MGTIKTRSISDTGKLSQIDRQPQQGLPALEARFSAYLPSENRAPARPNKKRSHDTAFPFSADKRLPPAKKLRRHGIGPLLIGPNTLPASILGNTDEYRNLPHHDITRKILSLRSVSAAKELFCVFNEISKVNRSINKSADATKSDLNDLLGDLHDWLEDDKPEDKAALLDSVQLWIADVREDRSLQKPTRAGEPDQTDRQGGDPSIIASR